MKPLPGMFLVLASTLYCHSICSMSSKDTGSALESLTELPADLANLLDQFTGKAVACSIIAPKRSGFFSQIKRLLTRFEPDRPDIDFFSLCPQGAWIMTHHPADLLICNEVESGKETVSLDTTDIHPTNGIIDGSHEHILLSVRYNSHTHRILHLDLKQDTRTDLDICGQKPFMLQFIVDPSTHTLNPTTIRATSQSSSYLYDIMNKRKPRRCSPQEAQALVCPKMQLSGNLIVKNPENQNDKEVSRARRLFTITNAMMPILHDLRSQKQPVSVAISVGDPKTIAISCGSKGVALFREHPVRSLVSPTHTAAHK